MTILDDDSYGTLFSQGLYEQTKIGTMSDSRWSVPVEIRHGFR